MIYTFLRALLLFVLLPFLLQAQHKINFPSGSFRDATEADFAPKNLPSKYFNELWTYHIKLENGVQVIYTFSINDFGSFRGRVTGGKLMVSWKDGNTYVVNKQYSPSEFINEPENHYIRLHPERPYWGKGNFDDEHRLSFHNTKDGVTYDLDLTLFDIAKGKVLGDGVYTFGSNEIGISILIPDAKVRGFVAINGDTLKATGTAYLDHIYQNNLSNEIIDRSYRVKTGDQTNGYFLHFLTLNKSNIQTPIGFGVRYLNGNAYLLTPSEIKQISSASHPRELDTEVLIDPFQMDPITARVEKHLNSYSMLNELGGIKKFLAKQVIGGELLEMHGTLRLNENQEGYFYYMVAK